MQIPSINFGINVPRPDLTQYLQARIMSGQNLQQTMAQALSEAGESIAKQQERQAAEAEARRQEELRMAQLDQFNADMATYKSNPSASNFAMMLSNYPGMQKQFEAAQEQFTEEDRQVQLSVVGPIISLLQNNQVDMAKELIDKRINGLQNSGNNAYSGKIQNLQNLKNMLDAEDNQAGAKAALETLIPTYAILTGVSDPAKLIEEFNKLPFAQRKARSEAEKAEEEAALKKQEAERDRRIGFRRDLATIIGDEQKANDLASQIVERDRRYELDVMKRDDEIAKQMSEVLSKGKDIPTSVLSKIMENVEKSSASIAMADKSVSIARAIQEQGGGWGAFNSSGEWLRGTVGMQNEWTAARSAFADFKSEGVLNKLQKVGGNDSDKDYERLTAGFPPDNADAEYVSNWLSSFGRAAAYNAAEIKIVNEWMNEFGGPRPGSAGVTIGGFPVKEKEGLDSFLARNRQNIYNGAVNEYNIGATQSRSYWRPPATP